MSSDGSKKPTLLKEKSSSQEETKKNESPKEKTQGASAAKPSKLKKTLTPAEQGPNKPTSTDKGKSLTASTGSSAEQIPKASSAISGIEPKDSGMTKSNSELELEQIARARRISFLPDEYSGVDSDFD